MADFKTSGLMYALAGVVIVFVIAESLFFLIKAMKRGKELGIKKEKLISTITTSALFSVAPAFSILATVLALSSALGIVLPWIRLSVIGNLQYETVAAESILNQFNKTISQEVTDLGEFSAVSWVMTIGCCLPLILLPIFCKMLHKKIGDFTNKNEKTSKLADVVAAGAFIGIISAFVAKSINGYTASKDPVTGEKLITSPAGFLSIATLIVSILLFLLLDTIAKKFNLKKFENFTMPIAMFGGMGAAVLLTNILPQAIVSWNWWIG